MATVDGLDVLLRRLDKLSVDGTILFNSAASGGLLIANQAKRTAPYQTGNLRRSIHVGGATNLTPEFSSAAEYHDLGSGPVKKNSATVYVGTDVEYAPAVEFGTATQQANPYLRPAFDTTKDAAVNEMKAAYQILIDKALHG